MFGEGGWVDMGFEGGFCEGDWISGTICSVRMRWRI